MKKIKGVATALALTVASAASAQSGISGGVVKIGVLTDMASLFSDIGGQGSVLAARMAAEDFGGKVLGAPIEIVFADDQNKADIGAAKAREWYDTQGVDMITDALPSSVALAVAGVAKEKNRIVMVTGAGTSSLTNDACSPNTVHYAYDTYMTASNTVKAMMKQGYDSWFFLTVDYALGRSLEKDASDAVKEAGGKLLGSVRHPTNASDMASFLLQAQSSGAKAIGMANAGGDTISVAKQAAEFGLLKSGKQALAGLFTFITDIHSIGLQNAQGMLLTTSFYWDENEKTRAWSKRFFERHKRMPTMTQAGTYSAVTTYLNAIKAAGTDDPKAVMAKMKSTPINDFFAKNGKIRADGRMVSDVLLVEVKKPSESKYPWDYYKIKANIPGDQAYLPLSKSVCPLVKK
jgi:branched-chain amino acid transport system substrate-binding protein